MSGIKHWGFAVDYENTLYQVSPVLHGNNSLLKFALMFALHIRRMHILFFFSCILTGPLMEPKETTETTGTRFCSPATHLMLKLTFHPVLNVVCTFRRKHISCNSHDSYLYVLNVVNSK